MVNRWTRFVQALLPPTCVLCGGKGQSPLRDLCADCESEWPLNFPACHRCGEPLDGPLPGTAVCGACLRRAPRFDASHCAYRYRYPVDALVRGLKYEGAIAYGRVLGQQLAYSLAAGRTQPWPDCILPVPLHPQRFRARGYNQAAELATPLEKTLGIRVRTDLVERTRETAEQAALSRKERRRNIKGAFAVTGRVAGLRIAILDDVVTTGSTVDELARVLKRAGASRMEVWSVAHAER